MTFSPATSLCVLTKPWITNGGRPKYANPRHRAAKRPQAARKPTNLRRSSAGGRYASGADSARAGIPGLVERCDYYGHDAMLTVRPQSKSADNVRPLPEKLLVRMPAGGQVSAGTLVKLTVRSPITVWCAQEVPAAA